MPPAENRGRGGGWPVVRLKGGKMPDQGIALGQQREYNPVAPMPIVAERVGAGANVD